MTLNTPIARFATRPGAGAELKDFEKDEDINASPDLIIGTLLNSGNHLLKSDYIYELSLNNITGVLELHEKGRSNIGKKWAHNYYEIQDYVGKEMWLTKEELSKNVV